MADREKVIKGLECHSEPHFGIDECFCETCPYDELTCGLDVPADALSLLKAQESRVMMVEEAQQAEEGTVVWFEQHTPERDYMTPMVSTGDGCIGNLYLGINLQYVKDGAREYRLWSGKPTDAQREATPWN